MKLIVGLGNPGPRYSGTRHNVGFLVIKRLAERWGISVKSPLCHSKTGEGTVSGEPVRLALPETMMNQSGEAAAALLKRFRLDPSSLLVVCDDAALPLGMIRVRSKGSDGGHQGLASVLQETRTEAVARLRVGIRTKPVGPEEMISFVLGRFFPSEKKRLEEGLELAEAACETWVRQGVSAAMNKFNRRVECPV
ncbi:MAG: aminoacyl-tRNA hydrolase [Candidatus Omnitrophica bacterium]|nr:aminoacyl-tRNA hydrolase [Candidatus Omnitrophota bacterium]